jgi:hypothetical protein
MIVSSAWITSRIPPYWDAQVTGLTVLSIRANAVRKPNRRLAVALLSSQGRTAVLAADSTLIKEFIVSAEFRPWP